MRMGWWQVTNGEWDRFLSREHQTTGGENKVRTILRNVRQQLGLPHPPTPRNWRERGAEEGGTTAPQQHTFPVPAPQPPRERSPPSRAGTNEDSQVIDRWSEELKRHHALYARGRQLDDGEAACTPTTFRLP